jgi:NAD-dependent dihydropyrimidine dehydrogenase PreA subunit/nitroreductase
MPNLNLYIDQAKCTGCGACVGDCICEVLTLNASNVPEVVPKNLKDCISCQHCLAVCPTGALSVFGLDPQKSLDLSEHSFPQYEKLKMLVRGRRSCRQFLDKNVPADLMDTILDDLAQAPTGCNTRALKFTVLGDIETMVTFRGQVYDLINLVWQIPAAQNNPVINFFKAASDDYQKRGRDALFRGAPHLLVITAPPVHVCAPQDVALSLAYFELLAVTAGLGVCWCGFLEMLDKCFPEIRQILGVDRADNMYAVMYGWPGVSYSRTVQRSGSAAVVRLNKESLEGNLAGSGKDFAKLAN